MKKPEDLLVKFQYIACVSRRLQTIGVLLTLVTWAASIALVQAQEDSSPVSVATVVATEVYDEIPLTGTVSSLREARIYSLVGGSVVRLLVKEGSEVRAGDTVLELDKTMAEIDLTRVRAELQEAEVRYREAIRQRDEYVRLVDKKAVADTEVARANSDVALYAAGVEKLQAELEREKELISRHAVLAPFPGVISEKFVELGSWIETSTPLVELVEIDALRVEVPVPQKHFTAVMVGTPVEVLFDALPGFAYLGEVTSRVPVSDNAARTFPTFIRVDNSERQIAPGMSARVTLKINQTPEALILPRDAVLRDSNGRESVWLVVEDDGVASGTSVEVLTGRNVDGWVEVQGELRAGDRVVVHGNESLGPDQKLEIVEEIQPRS